MPTWLTAVILLLRQLPALLAAIQRGEDFIELRIDLKKVDDAMRKAKDDDDTRPLNDLLPK